MAVHAFAKTGFSLARNQSWLVVLRNEVVEVVVRQQNDAAASPAIAAVGAALGAKFLAPERHAAFAAVSRFREDFDFVNEHAGVQASACFKKVNDRYGKLKLELQLILISQRTRWSSTFRLFERR
jgi:hypothetical protein